jgi:hypothetical protein
MHKCNRYACVISGCIICLVYVPAACFTDCVGMVHWLLLACHMLLLYYVLLLSEYCWLRGVLPCSLPLLMHARCLATHPNCASVYPTRMLASPAWPSHPILPACHAAADVVCYIVLSYVPSSHTADGGLLQGGHRTSRVLQSPPRGALASISSGLSVVLSATLTGNFL